MSFQVSINHWPGPEHLGSLICIRRNSRCGQTGPYKGRGSLTWLWGYVASCWGKGGGPRLCAPGPSSQGKGKQFYSCLSLDMISWVWTCLNPTLVLGLLPRAPRLQGCWTPQAHSKVSQCEGQERPLCELVKMKPGLPQSPQNVGDDKAV